ncbi:hypothetical protein X801_09868 [Opisthorchis viverrini]|uniref:Uncharacterized protein n=1 Tax=Opisthorchis viverrini TaxID=6198 RepID=A0A1S8WIR7_OPIVI|nr:hypothetical protein X801_09868 [Opisthorchis viverrini]
MSSPLNRGRRLNVTLDPHQYAITLLEYPFSKIGGGSRFDKIDLADGYLQIKTAKDSKDLPNFRRNGGLS